MIGAERPRLVPTQWFRPGSPRLVLVISVQSEAAPCGDFCNGASARVRLRERRDGHGSAALLSYALVRVGRGVWQRRRARLPELTTRWLGLCCCCMSGRHLARPELFGILLANESMCQWRGTWDHASLAVRPCGHPMGSCAVPWEESRARLGCGRHGIMSCRIEV